MAGRAGGPLAGLTFAAKDLFDVAGHADGRRQSGLGRPAGRCRRGMPGRCRRLLDAGATLIGKTITDEVSLGILGENAFDGTPLNARAPGRVPGGSSSGSAAAVAAGLCDTALGTDTGGSVRVPASFCGLYGIRPTHGRLDVTGMLPQAPTLRHDRLVRARRRRRSPACPAVMLGEAIPPALPSALIVAVDAFGFADAEVAAALQPMVKRAGRRWSATSREELLAPPGLSVWARAQRTLQPWEAWHTFKDVARPRQSALRLQRGPRRWSLGSMIPESERQLGRADAPGGARRAWRTCCRAGTDPLPADDAVPRAAARASRCRCSSRCAIASPACAPTAA